MANTPTCDKCGQSDEFLVSEDNVYICICGHQCSSSNQNDDSQSIAHFTAYPLNPTRVH